MYVQFFYVNTLNLLLYFCSCGSLISSLQMLVLCLLIKKLATKQIVTCSVQVRQQTCVFEMFAFSDGVLHVTCLESTTNSSQDVLIESS